MDQVTHPLEQEALRIFSIVNWNHWKKLWDETSVFEFRHSLLHFGFKVKCDTQWQYDERIIFYLEIADGFNESFEFYRENPSLQKLARKAFEVLCQTFFKQEENGHDSNLFQRLEEQTVSGKLLWFFRSNKYGGLHNFWRAPKSDHHAQTAKEFALELCEFILENKQEVIRKNQHAVIDLLAGLGKLDILRNKKYDLVDDACLAKLEAMSIGYDCHYGVGSYKAKTVEEAAAFGCIAAQVLLIRRNRTIELTRLKKIADLKRQEVEVRRAREDLERVTEAESRQAKKE